MMRDLASEAIQIAIANNIEGWTLSTFEKFRASEGILMDFDCEASKQFLELVRTVFLK